MSKTRLATWQLTSQVTNLDTNSLRYVRLVTQQLTSARLPIQQLATISDTNQTPARCNMQGWLYGSSLPQVTSATRWLTMTYAIPAIHQTHYHTPGSHLVLPIPQLQRRTTQKLRYTWVIYFTTWLYRLTLWLPCHGPFVAHIQTWETHSCPLQKCKLQWLKKLFQCFLISI